MSTEFVPGTNIPKPKVQLTGEDGNAMFIIARVGQALRRARVPQAIIDEYRKKSMDGDYNNVLTVAGDYADIG